MPCCDGCGKKTLAKALIGLPEIDVRTLAEEFEVAVSTVGRWRRGTASPHPLVAAQIIRRACELRERLADGSRSTPRSSA